MGWSCTQAAHHVLEAWSKACLENSGSQNQWSANGREYFFETGPERDDGSVTGSIWRFLGDGKHVKRSGAFRIEADGEVARAPKFLKKVASTEAEALKKLGKDVSRGTTFRDMGLGSDGRPMFELI